VIRVRDHVVSRGGFRVKVSYVRALSDLAADAPERPAVTCGAATATRAEMEAASNRLARCLQSRGVGPGDFVTIMLPNGIPVLQASVAAWKLGAIPQPVSWRLPAKELQAIVDLADSKVVIGAPDGVLAGRQTLPPGFVPPVELDDSPLPEVVAPAWKAPTSGGSTGRPKLIVAGDPAELDPDEPPPVEISRGGSIVVPGPLYHNAPFMFALFGLLYGNHVAVLERFDAYETLAAIERHQADLIMVVPTMMNRIWRLPAERRNAFDLSSLRVVWHMAAPCPPWLKEEWISWLGGDRIFELYGGTEGTAMTVITGTEWLDRRGSVGRCVIGEMRVLGTDGAELPPGEVGELFMRRPEGERPSYRYIGAEAKSLDGWESIGDLGWMDADGYVYLADRRTDLILAGGANIYPAEVEAALETHPAVASCAVIGLPDDDLGQRVHAIVNAVTDVTCEQLIKHVESHLVRYKVPRTIEFTDEPVRDDAGKVRRSALRDARVAAG
jgi:bile acid-coenzyme A ligase